ncbi:nicotinate-nucleotide pyrophosphorylase [carboxylating] [Hypnocyclicus thermotrophus]|uniref:Probable nicotinate-nucleotide pyrophosphorylase [carboxylating] n=1 Tax=Hypnocyclicus thermotrophus TaxID=1627895 RepID=A0AA46I559_9FUSO|nr:carboxylating nicotinate-nucleotide diphosphorylase [Hypnocyclicus thermotrophus]TDT68117.1 nicotinate-nucleotide pyrophosphorylase [carboxylating] [Hypnocyclicus thermotrophus]
MNFILIDKIINEALIEDAIYDDVTTLNIISKDKKAKIDLIAKEDLIICGLEVFKRVFDILGDVNIEFHYNEGEFIKNKEIVATLEGNAQNILLGERVALNLLQRMSGIATKTYNIVKLLEGSKIKVLDTRKTTPLFRTLEKYSVKIGGGYNHRFNLSDMAMIKDNHIKAAGSITKAVNAIRKNNPFIKKIEVECETLADVTEAIIAKADIIMLDNMDNDTMKKAINIINKQAIIEVSGNVTEERINTLKTLDIDYISIGALTHSVKSSDLSMKNLVIF